MRKIALMLCFSLILGLFAGCDSQEAYVPTGNALDDVTVATEETAPEESTGAAEGEGFSLAYYAEDGFNPYQCENFTNRMLFSLMYQGLFTVDKDYQVEPMLCKQYSVSEDGLTFTFYLEQATFHDGSALDAEDVVASYEAARNNPVYAGRFQYIDSVEATASDTVTIVTSTKYENLPLLLDIPIVRREQVEEEQPAGSGPYYLKQSSGGLVLQRRSNWWCQAEIAVKEESIPLWKADSPVQIRDWFEFDELGVAYADPGAASYVDYRCDYEVWDCETGIMLYMVCNTNKYVFSYDDVRAAIPYAIDRAKILEECYKGFGQAAVLPASPNSPFYDKGLASQVEYDPERLTTALTEHGLTGSTVTMLVNKNDSVRLRAARMIAQMLTDCGLVVKITENSTPYFQEDVYKNNFDIYLGQTQLSANMDVSEFFAPYGNLRWGDLSDPAIYEMCQEALENSGNYYNLHQMILADGRLMPILFRTYAVYMERGLMSDLAPSRDNVFQYSIGKTMEDALITQ